MLFKIRFATVKESLHLIEPQLITSMLEQVHGEEHLMSLWKLLQGKSQH